MQHRSNTGSDVPRHDEDAATWSEAGRRSARMEFDAVITSPRRARTFVGETVRGWGLGDVGELAQLLVSEVVTNAVEHGGSGGTIEVEALPAGIRVAVTDQSLRRPEQRTPSSDEPTGRGLAIVDQLSRWWGVELNDNGKTVWFEVDDVDLSHGW